ncbi:phospholipid methyltransferase-domain-containing protein [Calycina marina]|uniref:Phosphatidylethanolamine N-methyltransferase n=1 Tax=Calycina marina TaxID=1763456 RepID=A0A9P7Z3I0_9HELO|nr:phospholipid methyltransferase-domain-containing protein [Calycina marina]
MRERIATDATKSSGQLELEKDDEEKLQKTYGRTPNGTRFTVPQTHDMVSQLLDPRQPKNLTDLLVLAIMAGHIIALYLLPSYLKRPVFAILFLFWRGCYNIGIGYLLQIQSHHRRLITWARRMHLFTNPETGDNPRPWLYKLIKSELQTKIPEDYKFEDAPIEYNTWLVFRRVVDLILMCDFVSYCLFAIACGGSSKSEPLTQSIARWSGGIFLVGINLWIKLDAHRVVKDYAWYWGDFFYLIDQELTFDGVFEMAPHPMYSIGYVGYYGISAMAASFSVLAISIVAHVAQFAFLLYVENPHIEKTYNPPAPRKPAANPTPSDFAHANATAARKEGIEYHGQLDDPNVFQSPIIPKQPSTAHDLVGLGNIDLYRTTDVSVILLQGYVLLLTLFTPSTSLVQLLFAMNAVVWRLWFTVGLGVMLDKQSNKKTWTRHFVKYGESTEEAWRQWKGMYHLSMAMCYASFIAAAWKSYSFPADWAYGLVLLRHVVGTGLIALQMWTATSVYESLGEFGWFFGDFFFDHAPKLTYGGIYRYLNNPERIIGVAGIWGAVFITGSKTVFFLALFSHILSLAFIQFVEKPHMQKLYGRALRPEAGLSKNLRKSLPPPLKKWQSGVDKVLGDTTQLVEEFLDAARPKFAAGIQTVVRDTSALFNNYPTRLTLTHITPDIANINPQDYSLAIEGASSIDRTLRRAASTEGRSARFPQKRTDEYTPLVFEYGAPIKVKWTAPATHNKADWVGLYMVADNASRDVTRVASAGRWVPTVPKEYEDNADSGILISDQVAPSSDASSDLVQGEMLFSGDKLWWTQGVFEFRYHHKGAHNVLAISLPFEILITRFADEDVHSTSLPALTAVSDALLPVVQNCFDRDPEIAPTTADESFGTLVERDGKYAKRVVFAVHQMFGIEFASGVVLADGTVRKLAWRICNAKQVLAPYSMSHSRGTTTPTSEK